MEVWEGVVSYVFRMRAAGIRGNIGEDIFERTDI